MGQKKAMNYNFCPIIVVTFVYIFNSVNVTIIMGQGQPWTTISVP